MFLRVVHGFLIFAIITAPLLCCANGVARAEPGGCCQACGSDDAADRRDDGSTSPVPRDRNCCEMCQCICAGAVLEPIRVEASLQGGFLAVWGELNSTIQPGEMAGASGPGTLTPDPLSPVWGRSLRALYQSFLC